MNEDRFYARLEAVNDDARYVSLEEQQQDDEERAYELKKSIDNHINDALSDQTIDAFGQCNKEWADLVDSIPELEFDMISKEDKEHIAFRAWMLTKAIESKLSDNLEDWI